MSETKSLPLVSSAAQEDGPPGAPAFPRTYDIAPPAPLADLELFTKGHPFDAYRTLREIAPVCWTPETYAHTPDGPGFWAVTRYEDVRTVELDTKTFSSQKGGINMGYGPPETRHPLLHPATLNTMICLDAPYHLPLRREHMPFFTPDYVARLETRVHDKIDALLDAMAERGPHVDMVQNFSAELPLFTLCEMLGVPEADRPKLVGWMHHLEVAADTIARQSLADTDPALIMTFMASIQEMFDYGRAILTERRTNPREDLLSAIASATVDGAALGDEYLDGSWLLIVFAGNDTTRNSLSGTMRLLTEFPDQKAKLIDNPDLTPGMVDEAIRMISPVIHMRRTATRDTELADQKIAEGEKVIMWYGAANRDEAIFAAPDVMDVERVNASDHLAFGLGPHVCLGKRIANMQLKAAYRKILARFPKIEWSGAIEMAPNNFVHAISKLEVNLNGNG
ncbi:MAG: cytochrome P450 [Pseudomonadota bacterium]